MESQHYLTVPGAALRKEEREWIKDTAACFLDSETTVFFGIGVMRGGSFHCMRAGNSRAIIYALDIDYKTKPIHRPDLINGIWLEGDSRYFEFEDKIDFLFVDGDHHYNVIRQDIQNWKDRIATGGIIAFHDYAPLKRDLGTMPWLDGVRKAVEEWDKSGFEEIARVKSIIAFRKIT